MSIPKIPERKQLEALTDILESIALEETAFAHLINAEAEKVQKSLCEGYEHHEVIEIQESVAKIVRLAIKKEILLQFKLEAVLEAKAKLEGECDDLYKSHRR